MIRLFALLAMLTAAACDGGELGAAVAVSVGCDGAPAVSFTPVEVGQRATALVKVFNPGPARTTPLPLALEGPDAADVSIRPFDSSCTDGGVLEPGGVCVVTLDLAPMSAGDKHASLRVGSTEVPLNGVAVLASASLRAEVANLPFLAGGLGAGTRSFFLTNQGSTDVALGPHEVTGDGFVLHTSDDCPATLRPGAACTVQLGFAQFAEGCVAGALTLRSSGAAIVLPVASEFLAIAQIHVRGPGSARITSQPAGIDCRGGDGTTCGHWFDAPAVTLTVAPEAGTLFNGWSSPECGQGTTCELPVGPFHHGPSVVAELAPADSKAIRVTLAGDAPGAVTDGQHTCRSSPCTIYVPDGTQRLELRATTTSRFVGWSGACDGSAPTCDLGLVINDRDVTATFARDPGEVATITPRAPTAAVGYLGGGDLIVAGGTITPATGLVVSRLTPAGAVIWSKFEADVQLASSVVTTPSDDFYLRAWIGTGMRITRHGPDGARRWSVAVPGSDCRGSPLAGTDSIARLGEDVVVVSLDAGVSRVQRLAAEDGQPRWSVDLPGCVGVAVAPDGTIAVSSFERVIRRFTGDGAPRLPDWTVPGSGQPLGLAFDAGGNLTVLADAEYSFEHVVEAAILTRFSPAGAILYSVPLDSSMNTGGGHVVALAGGKVAALRVHHWYQVNAGAYIEVYDAAGTRVSLVDKWGARTGPGAAISGFVPIDLVAHDAGFAVLGVVVPGWRTTLATYMP